MFKLTVIMLALAVTFVSAQSPGGQCSDEPNFVGTQPQNKGKKCEDQTVDNCLFIDESIIKCCQTCNNKNDTRPSTAAPKKGKKHEKKPKPKSKKNRKGCFHGDDMVHTKEYGTISMSQLAEKRDAHVLTRKKGQLEFLRVRYWLHAQPSLSMKFLTLSLESGQKLAITTEHLIFEADCHDKKRSQAIFAKNVQVGSCLLINDNGQLKASRIIEKGEEKMTGIYAPITASGNIVVNDVLASCYSYFDNVPLQNMVFQFMIQLQDVLANWMPQSVYLAAFNNQNGAIVTMPRFVFNFLQLSNYLVH